MDSQRLQHLDFGFGELTPEEFKEGWHFCRDWDGMLINKFTSPERSGCTCPLENWN